MNMNIDIYMPRLDITFKEGPAPKERSEIPAIRQYWMSFCNILRTTHLKAGHQARLIEAPLWKITTPLVSKVSADSNIIYIPHKMNLNWVLDERVRYYMQMVIPSIFSVDPEGWCASTSNWPIAFDSWKETEFEPDISDLLTKRISNNISKFNQPNHINVDLPENYVLFPCQIPHDETIKYHSDISVEDALRSLLSSLRLIDTYSIVIKGHPANPGAMKVLKDIYLEFKKKLPDNLSKKIIWIDTISIHQLLASCKAVFTVNSGVGLEALLHRKKVYTFGNADYASASTKIIFGGNIENATQAIANELIKLKRDSGEDITSYKSKMFINSWYYTHYDCESPSTFSKIIKNFKT